MQSGLILVGEPMGLLIAQTKGSLDSVSGYDLAVAGAEFNVAIGTARLEHKVTYMTKLVMNLYLFLKNELLVLC